MKGNPEPIDPAPPKLAKQAAQRMAKWRKKLKKSGHGRKMLKQIAVAAPTLAIADKEQERKRRRAEKAKRKADARKVRATVTNLVARLAENSLQGEPNEACPFDDTNAFEVVFAWSDGRSFSVGGWAIDLYRTPDGRWVQHFQNGPGAFRNGELVTWYFEPLSAEKAKNFLRACEQHHLIEKYFPLTTLKE